MKNSLIFVLAVVFVCAVAKHTCVGQPLDPLPDASTRFLTIFIEKLKTRYAKIRDDIKLLWDDVLEKADNMKGWTSDMYSSFRRKLAEELEKLPSNVSTEEEKRKILEFIAKLEKPIFEGTQC